MRKLYEIVKVFQSSKKNSFRGNYMRKILQAYQTRKYDRFKNTVTDSPTFSF